MNVLNAGEAIRFFKSYGFGLDEESVKEWVKENNMKAATNESRSVNETDLHKYNDWCAVKGTAYEDGIDDKTKIARLLEEVASLQKEVKNLKDEKRYLEKQLGMNDWI